MLAAGGRDQSGAHPKRDMARLQRQRPYPRLGGVLDQAMAMGVMVDGRLTRADLRWESVDSVSISKARLCDVGR